MTTETKSAPPKTKSQVLRSFDVTDFDIPALEVLEDSLEEFPGAVVLVSHDRDLTDRLCTAVAGLDGRGKGGITYELGGPRVYSFRELLDLVAEYTEHRRPYFPIPFWLAKLQGLVLQVLPNAPLTLDQVRLLQSDNLVSKEAVSDARNLEALGIAPHAVEVIVPNYLVRFRPKGEFSVRSV